MKYEIDPSVSPFLSITDHTLRTKDGIDLFVRLHMLKSSSTKPIVLIVHGFGEHTGRYLHVAAYLNEQGFSVILLDQRGFGQSTGIRAYVDRFEQFSFDLELLVKFVQKKFGQEQKLVMLGHSMGGLITTRFIQRYQNKKYIQSAVVTGPEYAICLDVPKWKEWLGWGLSFVLPKFTIPTEISSDILTHDEETVKETDADPLMTRVSSTRIYVEMMKHADLVFADPDIEIPFLCFFGGDDRVCKLSTAKEFMEKKVVSEKKEFVELPRLFHEVLNEPSWKETMARICDFFDNTTT